MPSIFEVKINILDSPATPVTTEQIKDPIFLIYQFFTHPNVNRHKEIQLALKMNVQNPFISKIYLLNERIYTKAELGLVSPKIKQIVLGKRLTFKSFFDFIQGDNLKGYCITCNADIFLDSSNAVLFRISKPFCAETAVEIATTSGMASPKACGQAITITVTILSKAYTNGKPKASQTANVPKPITKAM